MNKVEEEKEDFLHTVLATILNKSKKPSIQINEENLNEMYKTLEGILSNYDNSIKQCKKYNEAKIHRKYEVAIADLQKKIFYLNDKIKAQRSARSPSKKYIDELLDKLVNYKHEKEDLKKENGMLKNQVSDLIFRLRKYENSMGGKKQASKNLQGINESNRFEVEESQVTELKESKKKPQKQDKTEQNLKVDVENYLKFKHEVRKEMNEAKTMFQRFLKKNLQDLSLWNFRQFLSKIDQWSQSMIEVKQNHVDKTKFFSDIPTSTFYGSIRTARQRTFSNTKTNFRNRPISLKRKNDLSDKVYQTLGKYSLK